MRLNKASVFFLIGIGFVFVPHFAFASQWDKSTLPNAFWYSMAASADGTNLIAGNTSGKTYVSTDSGATWSNAAPAPGSFWQELASSADGSRFVGTISGSPGNNGIYISNNGGTSWVKVMSADPTNGWSGGWSALKSSADGTKLVAFDGSSVYMSTDSGTTWNGVLLPSIPSNHWSSLAMSADGTKLAASRYGGSPYISNDGGLTWTPSGSIGAGSTNEESVAMSADGAELVVGISTAAANEPEVYTSNDAGVTWIGHILPSSNPSGDRIQTVLSSADGTKIAAVDTRNPGGVYLSTDNGATWIYSGLVGTTYSLVASTDGTKVFAGNEVNDGVYIFMYPDLTADSATPSSVTMGITTDFSAPITNNGPGSTIDSFSYFFQLANAPNGGGIITDLGAATMPALAANQNVQAHIVLTFTAPATYSLRVCADKSNAADTGTIIESNENNNCGPWTPVTVLGVPSGSISETSCTLLNGACDVYVSWTSSNTNQNKVDIYETDPQGVTTAYTGQDAAGTLVVTATQSGTYTFDLYNLGVPPVSRDTLNSAAVSVYTPPTLTCNNSPACTVDAGEPVTLDWACSETGASSSANFPTGGQKTGSVSVTPMDSTTYVLQCAPPGNTGQVTVTVLNPDIIFNTSSLVPKGGMANVEWSATNVQSCQVSGPGVSQSGLSGSVTTPSIFAPTQYQLTCQTNLGPVSIFRTVRMVPQIREI